MNLTSSQRPQSVRRKTALAVLALALATTCFAVWQERELAVRNEKIRFQEGIEQASPLMQNLLVLRFAQIMDIAKVTLRREDYSQTGWDDFLKSAPWMKRFPGLAEIGFAEVGGDRCVVKFAKGWTADAVHPAGFDLDSVAEIRATVQACTDSGYAGATETVSLSDGTNTLRAIVGMLPMFKANQRLGSAAENRANLRGLIFFALDQQEYFHSCEPQMAAMPFTLHLLTPEEKPPEPSPTQRFFGTRSVSGEWRVVATMKSPPETARMWIVGVVGAGLSCLLYFLFITQGNLRFAAELANEITQARESEISTLNRDLDKNVAALTQEKELNRLKSNFVSMVTHEIRTPLMHILGSAEVLSRYLERLPAEKRAEHLKNIGTAVQRMNALVEDVLLFSKAEAGRMEFNPVTMDLKTFCAQIVDEVTSATNRRCPFELKFADVFEPARGDENLLRHIFSNLLVNAAKYSPPGTPVSFSVSRDEGNAVFVVRDAGMGIPMEDRKRLFTPFYRGRNVAALQGTGLGLTIVKHCVEQHGGSIAIESKENVGTTVRVRLPLFSPAHTEFTRRLDTNSKPA